MHRIFQFSDEEYTQAFERGFREGRAQQPFLTDGEQSVSFSFNAIGRQLQAGLLVELLPPLREARYEGWRRGEGNPREIAEMASIVLTSWRRHRQLRFLVKQADRGPRRAPLQQEERAHWNTLTYRLEGDGFGPLPPVSQPEFRLTRDTMTDVGLAERPLRFDVERILPATSRDVTLVLELGDERHALTFPL